MQNIIVYSLILIVAVLIAIDHEIYCRRIK